MSPTFAQSSEDSTDGSFHDDLLNHLVGKWDVAAIVHNNKFTIGLEAEWVMNHQYLHVHFKSQEIVPWLKVPFEGEFFFGFNKTTRQYTVHEMTVHGDDGPYEGFCYAYQTDNEFKLMKKWVGSDTVTVQRFTWAPVSKSWHIDVRLQADGKEGESLVDMNLVAAKPSAK
ncbi:MAG TPA: hypothetical protein VK666_23300 [Chryseolinea sp.]|nr:hypothetical protein [Chryseolinea sp.]